MQTSLLSVLAAAITAPAAVHSHQHEFSTRGTHQQFSIRNYEEQPYLLGRDDALLSQQQWLIARRHNDMNDYDSLLPRSTPNGKFTGPPVSSGSPGRKTQQAQPQGGNTQGSGTAGPQDAAGSGGPASPIREFAPARPNMQGDQAVGHAARLQAGGVQQGTSLGDFAQQFAQSRPGARYTRFTGQAAGQPARVERVEPGSQERSSDTALAL